MRVLAQGFVERIDGLAPDLRSGNNPIFSRCQDIQGPNIAVLFVAAGRGKCNFGLQHGFLCLQYLMFPLEASCGIR